MGGQAEEEGLAPGSWPGRPPIGEGVGWVRGQLLGWGGWGGWPWGQAGSSYTRWCLSLLSLGLSSLALSLYSLNLDLALLSALGSPCPKNIGPRNHPWVQDSSLISSWATTTPPTPGASPSAQGKGPPPKHRPPPPTPIEGGRRS